MRGAFVKDRYISLEEAQRIAKLNGLRPVRDKETGRIDFSRSPGQAFEPITWEELSKEVTENGLRISESGGYLRVSRPRTLSI